MFTKAGDHIHVHADFLEYDDNRKVVKFVRHSGTPGSVRLGDEIVGLFDTDAFVMAPAECEQTGSDPSQAP